MGTRSGPKFLHTYMQPSRWKEACCSTVNLRMGPGNSGAKDMGVLQSAPKSFEKLHFSLTGLDELGVLGQHELVKM